jgi:hypothetical protein
MLLKMQFIWSGEGGGVLPRLAENSSVIAMTEIKFLKLHVRCYFKHYYLKYKIMLDEAASDL